MDGVSVRWYVRRERRQVSGTKRLWYQDTIRVYMSKHTDRGTLEYIVGTMVLRYVGMLVCYDTRTLIDIY